MTLPLHLGIDLGTTGLKAVLLREDGTLAGMGYRDYPIDIPEPGHAQQHPGLWWRALVEATAQAVRSAGAGAGAIRSIGLSGQMHGLVPLDAHQELLCPAIIWCDQRSAAQSRRVWQAVGTQKLGRWIQNPIATGFQATSLLWLREQRPDLYGRLRTALLPKDYLRYRLTGVLGTDPTDACSTLLFNCAKRRWSTEMLRALDVDRSILPAVAHSPAELAGRLSRRAARELGLKPGTPVAFGGGDQPMQAVGNGILHPGDASVTIGTGGQILLPVKTPVYDPLLRTHTFCHAPRDRWYVMGATLNAALALNWFAGQVLGERDLKQLDAGAAQVKPGCGGLIFLPYLTGERTPHLNPAARGLFFGLTPAHGKYDMVRAVLEGVAFSLHDAMDVMTQLGLPVQRLVMSGGGAQSALWRQIMADVFERPVHTSAMREEAAAGAAICAMVAVGVYPALDTACDAIVRYEAEPVQPNPRTFDCYRAGVQRFRSLYRANAPLF
ncbi:MAG: xylulokinase [Lentisphaeria bacterium]